MKDEITNAAKEQATTAYSERHPFPPPPFLVIFLYQEVFSMSKLSRLANVFPRPF